MATKITVIAAGDDDDDRPEDAPEPSGGVVSKRSIPQIRLMEAQAIELAAKGYTYRQIAAELGFSSSSSAVKALERGLARYVRPNADKVARLQDMRIALGYKTVFEVLAHEEYMATPGGKNLVNPVTGEYVPDDERRLRALDRLVALMEREAKLHGIDAPSKKMTMNMTPDQIRDQTRELQERFGVTGPDDPNVIQGYPEDEDDDPDSFPG